LSSKFITYNQKRNLTTENGTLNRWTFLLKLFLGDNDADKADNTFSQKREEMQNNEVKISP
jgi:hypothetical protein